jgi:hypothetical protein
MKMLTPKTTSKGYTLLFAVLVSSLVLAIGISILNISKKEFLIATSARDSSAALYAADSGLECGIYLDGEPDLFSVDDDNYLNASAFKCNVPHNDVVKGTDTSGNPTFTFHAKFSESGDACAVVTVTKQDVLTGGVLTGRRTIIDSRGYNRGWVFTNGSASSNEGTCSVPSAKRVERALSYSTL